MTRTVAWEAGHSIETSMKRGQTFKKRCKRCCCLIERRKTYCSPCYGIRHEENIAANRHKYQKPKSIP